MFTMTRGDASTPYTDLDALAADGKTKQENGYTVVVYNEAGTGNDSHTVTVTGWDKIENALTKVAYGSTAVELKANVTAYYDYQDAVNARTELSVAAYEWIRFYGDNDKIVTDGTSTYPVQYMAFTTSAQALACTTFDTDSDPLNYSTDGALSYQLLDVKNMENGQVVVISYVPQGEGSERVYIAFEIEK